MPTLNTIIGRPGTGKTTKLASLVERAVTRFGPERVVVASLTRTAAHEIASREIKGEPLWELLGERVGTLHAICYRALGKPALVYGTLKEFNEATKLGVSTSSRVDVDDLGGERESRSDTDALLEAMERNRARCLPRELWAMDVRAFAEKWDWWKENTATIDFSDMVELATRRLPKGPSGPATAIFYDEAQDGSRLELELLQQWAAHADHAVICGDDLQSLYTWRGASVESFLGWSEQRLMLGQSYRLPRAVLAAAVAWSRQIQVRAPGDYLPRDEEGEVRQDGATYKDPEGAVLAALSDVAQGKRVMLLASCSYMLQPLLAVLKSWAIPFHNPHRAKRGDWNPLRRAHGEGATASGRILDFAAPARSGRAWTWKELHRWLDVVDAGKGVLVHGAKALVARKVKDASDATVTADELPQLLREEGWEPALSGDLRWLEEHLLPSKADSMRFPLAVAKKHGPAELEKTPMLTVGTVHSVKGAETDVTYLFPDLSPAAWDEWDSGDRDQRDAVLRTFYVGMTRSREKLVLCEPSSGRAVDWWPALEAA